MHPCNIIYALSSRPVYGREFGVCRITGEKTEGVLFDEWVSDKFTDWHNLKPGTIIGNAARFCFDEKSEYLQQKTGRDKPQRFRTYSHIVVDDQWHTFTKANKQEIFKILTTQQPAIVVLSDSGQRHLLFKHIPGLWQLEDDQMPPEPEGLIHLHSHMMKLQRLGFSQKEIFTGKYQQHRVMKAGVKDWKQLDSIISPHRGSLLFDISAWLLWAEKAKS